MFGEILLWTFTVFLFFAYLMVLWTIFTDLFSDKDTSGWAKALWVVFLIFMPLLAALVYLVARGRGMQERKIQQMQDIQRMQETYIKQVAGAPSETSATDQIAQAKALLDSGAISQEEFASLKAKALA